MVGTSLRTAWRVFERSFWMLAAGAALGVLPELALGGVRVLVVVRAHAVGMPALIASVLLAPAAAFAMHCLMRPGYVALQTAALRREPLSFSLLCSAGDRAWSLAGAIVLRRVIVLACTVGAAIPGAMLALLDGGRPSKAHVALLAALAIGGHVVASMNLVLVDWCVCVERMDAWTAVRASWQRSRSCHVQVALLYVIVTVIELAGVIAGVALFGFGVLVTVPLSQAFATAVLTRAHARLRQPSDAPQARRATMTPAAGGSANRSATSAARFAIARR